MQPPLPSELDNDTLDRLEQYFVDGDQALGDAHVVKAVTANSTIVTRMRVVLQALQVKTHPNTEQSLDHAMRARGLRPSYGVFREQSGNTAESRLRTRRLSAVTRYLWPTLGVALLCLAGLYANHTNRLNGRQPSLTARGVTYSSANGQRTTVTLPDGSTVLLNVASRLEIPENFGVSHRTVMLQGEALFKVSHLTGQPFTVMAGAISTRVLGTTFLVRRYHTDTATTVAVQNGKVAVQSVVVPASWQANAGPMGAIALQPADTSRFTFASGILTLTDVSLPDAITELSRWYDVDIRLASPKLAEYRITATCPASSLETLIAIFEFTLNVRVERIGRTLTLYPKGA